MKKFAKTLAIVNVLLFLFSFQFASAKVIKKATVRLIQQPKSQLTVGDRGILKFNAGNFAGRVQYRVVLRDLNANRQIDLYKIKDKVYTGIISSGKNVFTINYNFKTAGKYQFIIYVKRAGYKNYDSFVRTGVITVNKKAAVVDKEKDNTSVGGTGDNSTGTSGENTSNQSTDTQNQTGQNGEGNSQTNNSGTSTGTGSASGTDTQNGNSQTGGTTGNTGGTTGGTSDGQNPPQEQGIVKSLNITLGNGNVVEGLITGNSYNFDLKSLKDDETVLKINFLLDKNATIEVAGKKFNATANKTLSINLPSDLGMVDNPPPGVTLASIRQYDSSFNLTFTINDGAKKIDVNVKLVVK